MANQRALHFHQQLIQKLFLLFNLLLLSNFCFSRDIVTPYYQITLPDYYRHSISPPENDGGESVVAIFDNRFMKTSSIFIESSTNDEVDIDDLKEKTAQYASKNNSQLVSLPCNNCQAHYAFIPNRRKNEHIVIMETKELRVYIQYLAEDQAMEEKSFILGIANQIHAMN